MTGQDRVSIPPVTGEDGDLVRGQNTFSAAGTAEIVAAPGAGLRLHFDNIIVTNGDASNAGTVTVKEGDDTLFVDYAAADGGGYALRNITLKANKALNVTVSGATTSLNVSATGRKVR